MEQEIFKIYKIAYTNQYRTSTRIWEVSNLGRVKCNGKIVEPHINNSYLFIGTFFIHRAVAELFVPNPENKTCVDHINTDRLDNRAENLRWVTQKENCNNPLTRVHCSEAHMGIPSPLKGKTHSEEAKRKMSESHKGKPRKPLSEETKRKISESWVRRKKRES